MIYVPIYSLWIITLYSMLLYEGIATNQRISFTETDKLERRHIGRLLRSVKTVEQYSWTEWSPALNFTCKNGEITFYHSECSAGSGVVEQSRSCVDTVTNTNAFDPLNGQQCATDGNTAGSTRQINCNTPQVCADWSNWGPCVNCVNGNCTNLNAREKTGQTRHRECQQEFRTDEECSKQWQLGLCVKRSTGGGLVPDVRNAGGGVSSEGVTPVDAFSGSAKIAAFCIAGVVMVGLLGFAGSRFLRTAMQRPRPREPVEMEVSLNQERNNSIVSSERMVVVTVPQGRPRPVVGRRNAHPMSNLSVIREEDDVTSIRRQSIQNSVKTDRNDTEEAIEFMDEMLIEVEREEDTFVEESEEPFENSAGIEESLDSQSTTSAEFKPDLRKSAVDEEDSDSQSTTSAEFKTDFRKSAVGNEEFLREYGWSTEARERTKPQLQRLGLENNLRVPGSEEVFTASAMSLASARLLNRTTPSRSSVGTCESNLGDDSMVYCNSSVDLRRVCAQDTKQYSSMPDLNKAASIIPDIEEVLSTDSENDIYDEAFV